MKILLKLIAPKAKSEASESSLNSERVLSCYKQVFTLFRNCGFDPVLTIIKLQQRGCSPHLADYYTGLTTEILKALQKENEGESSSLNTLYRQLKSRGLQKELIDSFLQISKEMTTSNITPNIADNKPF